MVPLSVHAERTNFIPRYEAPNRNETVFYADNPFYQAGFGMPNCTAYAYGRAWEILGNQPNLSRGNAGQWWNYNRNGGFYEYGSTPKLGAVACWDKYDSNQGHVAVVEAIDGNQVTISESHWQGVNFDTRVCNDDMSNYLPSMRFLGYIYIGNYEANQCLDLGTDFYAYIINTPAWRHLTNDGFNVSIRDETGSANQVWKFDRDGDGAYKITNCQDGNVLDVHNFGSADGTNVAVAASNDSSAQRWYIYGESGAYYLKAKCSDLVLDIAGGSTENGANVQMWTKNDTPAQNFQIWKLNRPDASTIHCAPGTNFTPTSIWWIETSNTQTYNVKIWKEFVGNGEAYKCVWGVKESSCSLELPEGNYEAYVDSCNAFSCTRSQNTIKFTVQNGIPLDIGNDFYAAILVNKNWLNLTNVENNVQLEQGDGVPSARQVWHFIRQNDGTYCIFSCLDGKALDVDRGLSDDGTNVQVYEYNGTDAQKWYVYGRGSGEYYIQPKYAYKVLDVCGGNNNPGDNIQIWSLNYTDAQKFAVYGLNVAENIKLNTIEKQLVTGEEL